MLTGLDGLANVEQPNVFDPVGAIVEHRFVRDNKEVAVGQGQRVVGAASEWWRPVSDGRSVPDCERSCDIHDDEATVAPRAIGRVSMDDRVVQAGACLILGGVLARRQHSCRAANSDPPSLGLVGSAMSMVTKM